MFLLHKGYKVCLYYYFSLLLLLRWGCKSCMFCFFLSIIFYNSISSMMVHNNSIVVLIVLFCVVYNFFLFVFRGYWKTCHFWYFNNHICKIGNCCLLVGWMVGWFDAIDMFWKVDFTWFINVRVHFAYIMVKMNGQKKNNLIKYNRRWCRGSNGFENIKTCVVAFLV